MESLSTDFAQVKEGDEVYLSKVITERDIETFAEITGDCNQLHLNNELAKRTVFKGRVAHGMLVAGLISAVLSEFPGIVVYISQTLKFYEPVRIGDKIKAIAVVKEKINTRNELKLQTVCKNQHGDKVIDGEARIRMLELEG